MDNKQDIHSDIDELLLDEIQDEIWDEDIDDIDAIIEDNESTHHTPDIKKQKKPLIPVALILGAFGLGAYLLIPIFLGDDTNELPIVQIQNPAIQQPVEKSDLDVNEKDIVVPDLGTPQEVQQRNEALQRDNVAAQIDAEGPLIPLPNEAEIDSQILVDLDLDSEIPNIATQTPTDEAAPEDKAHLNIEEQEQGLIDETLMISKTNSELETIKHDDDVTQTGIPTIQPKTESQNNNSESLEEIVQNDDVPLQIAEKQVIKETPPQQIPPKPSPKAIAKQQPAPKAAWTIKAAQPGKAVIFDKASNITKSIEVNDELKSIGRILSISNQTGEWVIQGSKGSIKN